MHKKFKREYSFCLAGECFHTSFRPTAVNFLQFWQQQARYPACYKTNWACGKKFIYSNRPSRYAQVVNLNQKKINDVTN